jgi:voltage-gated sodium channel
MTFEDWTDVMYEVMKVYSLSWIYFITFIFFTAFAFLNMVIGIVVNVLEEENQRMKDEDDKLHGRANLDDLQREIRELKVLIIAGNKVEK